MGKLRLFICAEIEEEALKEKLASFLAKPAFKGLKRVKTEQMHLTLKFLGETDEQLVEDIKSQLGMVKFTPFSVELNGMGCFPGTTRPRVVWVGLSGGTDQLVSLAKVIDERMQSLGFPREKRAFSPHLTLARVKKADLRVIQDLQHLVLKNKESEFGRFTVTKIILKRSTLTPRGPIYENLFILKPLQENGGN
ncbi:MAG: RNA 2',3'-cyclic phosphodiesterase [Candidatus Hodarchaeales archaeon]|jgi:2'-5' RNA ligase